MELGYFSVKGRAELVRLTLAYFGQSYTETDYVDVGDWESKKEGLGLAFPSLPYLIDGEHKITDPIAIVYYLAHKVKRENFLGTEGEERRRVMEIVGVLKDIEAEALKVLSSDKPETEYAEDYEKVFKPKAEYLSKSLAHKDYLVGDVCIADVYFYSVWLLLFDIAKRCDAKCPIKDHQNLADLLVRIEKLPGVREYLRTVVSINMPVLSEEVVTVQN